MKKRIAFARGPHLFLRWGLPVLIIILFLAFVISINRVEKTQLVSREGQTFEKGVVVEILQDNLQSDGTRLGEQVVLVEMRTGVRAGETIETTSSAGLSLRRALPRRDAHSRALRDAERGRRFHHRQRLRPEPRMGHLCFCSPLSSDFVPGGRKAGRQSLRRPDLHLPVHSLLSTCPWSTGAGRPSGFRCWCASSPPSQRSISSAAPPARPPWPRWAPWRALSSPASPPRFSAPPPASRAGTFPTSKAC